MPDKSPVVIIGAGVAGLCCALDVKAKGIPVCVLEKEARPGGRVRTEDFEGFRLDRGFQVWLEAYPQCRKRLDPRKLQAGAFGSGAVIFDGKRLRLFADPFRHPRQALKSVCHPVGSLRDKVRMQILRSRLTHRDMTQLFSGEEMSAMEYWQKEGFSSQMIQGFLSPFFRGIFLAEPEDVSRRMFDFVFSMFGQGKAYLPAGGIQALPDALAAELHQGELRLSTPAEHIQAHSVRTGSGEQIAASAVVVTVPDDESLGVPRRESRSVSCLYFDAPKAPVQGPWLILNGSGQGNVTQVSVNSSVAPGYAPAGRHLISVSLNGLSEEGESMRKEAVMTELRQWFGSEVNEWRFLKEMEIAHALPAFGEEELPGPGWVEKQGIFYAGDGFLHPSLQGAMESGSRVAAELLKRLD